MGLWIDDTLSEQDRWLDMTPAARACLVELWLYCKRARNDGVLQTTRLSRAADSFTPEVMAELIANNWLHKDGTGCGTDTCPKGTPRTSVLHDFLQYQESAKDMSVRMEKSREKSRQANHIRWHAKRNVFDKDCRYCLEDVPLEDPDYP